MPKQRTKVDMAALRAAILEILRADHPQTVRQVLYQLVVRGAVKKNDTEYSQTVSRLLGAILRDLVDECIGQHISEHELEILREAERSERSLLRMLARDHGGDPD
jgi:hypothetical protein